MKNITLFGTGPLAVNKQAVSVIDDAIDRAVRQMLMNKTKKELVDLYLSRSTKC